MRLTLWLPRPALALPRAPLTLLLASFVLVAMAVVPRSAHAVETGGTINGEVVDQSDTPIEFAEITLSGPSMQGIRFYETDENGVFRFLNVPPGSDYVVEIDAEGFKTHRRTGLVVDVGRTISIRAVMELPEAGETIDIVDRREVVDLEETTTSESLSDEFLGNLPSGRSFQDVVQFLPGVTGGGNPNVNGSGANTNQYFVDGVNTTDPVTNTFSSNFNFDAIQSVEVITAGFDAKYGQGLGAVINIVTKSGGNKFEGDFSVYYQTSGLQNDDRLYETEFQRVRDLTVNASLGGPIVKDAMWFFVAYSYQWNNVARLPASTVERDYSLHPIAPRIWNGHLPLAKITWQVADSHKLTLTGSGEITNIQNTTQSATRLADAEGNWNQGGGSVALRWDWTVTPSFLLTVQADYRHNRIDVEPIQWRDCETRGDFGVCEDADLQLSAQRPAFTDGFWHGSQGFYNYSRRNRLGFQLDGRAFVDRAAGSHRIDFGVGASPTWVNSKFAWINNEIVFESVGQEDDDPNVSEAELNDLGNYDTYGRLVVINDEASTQRGLTVNAYVQDQWFPTSNLNITLGGRYVYSDQRNNVGRSVLRFNAFTFGGSLGWDPFRDRKTQIRLSYARLVDSGFLAIAGFLDESRLNSEFYIWDDEQGAYAEGSERASSPAQPLLHHTVVPHSEHQVQFSLIRELQRDLRGQLTFLYRRQRNFWETDEVNVLWNKDGTDSVGFRDGDNTDILRMRTPDDSYRNHYSLQLVVRKNLSDNVELLASYTFARTVGNANNNDDSANFFAGDDYDNPQQRYYESGILQLDRPHVVRLLTSYDNPNAIKVTRDFYIGWGVGAVFDLQAGQPSNRFNWNEWYRGHANLTGRRGTVYRMPASVNLDIRATLDITLFGRQFDIILQAFNLLNTREVLAIDQRGLDENGDIVTDAAGNAVFGSPLTRQLPRRFEVGARFRF